METLNPFLLLRLPAIDSVGNNREKRIVIFRLYHTILVNHLRPLSPKHHFKCPYDVLMPNHLIGSLFTQSLLKECRSCGV